VLGEISNTRFGNLTALRPHCTEGSGQCCLSHFTPPLPTRPSGKHPHHLTSALSRCHAVHPEATAAVPLHLACCTLNPSSGMQSPAWSVPSEKQQLPLLSRREIPLCFVAKAFLTDLNTHRRSTGYLVPIQEVGKN